MLLSSVWLDIGDVKLRTSVVVGVLILGTPEIWIPDEVFIENAEFFL